MPRISSARFVQTNYATVPWPGAISMLQTTVAFDGGLLAYAFMLVAVTFHWPNGFFWADGGWEYPAFWGLIFLAILLRGGGPQFGQQFARTRAERHAVARQTAHDVVGEVIDDLPEDERRDREVKEPVGAPRLQLRFEGVFKIVWIVMKCATSVTIA